MTEDYKGDKKIGDIIYIAGKKMEIAKIDGDILWLKKAEFDDLSLMARNHKDCAIFFAGVCFGGICSSALVLLIHLIVGVK